MLAARQQQRVHQPLARDRGALDAVKLGIDEADVERGVVDHQRGVADELQKLVGDLVEQWFRRQEFGRQSVHRERFRRHVPFRVDVDVKGLPRRHAVEDLDAADFDESVAAERIEAGRFGVEDDFAHVLVAV